MATGTDLSKIPERTLGFEVAAWMEEHLVHGPGDVAGLPYRLTAENIRFLAHAYELDERGRRIYRRAVYSRRKGVAKSELGGALCAAELDGPVRCDGFDARGEPVGRPVSSSLVQVAATSEDQADDTVYSKFRAMAEPKLGGVLDLGLVRTFSPTGEVRLVTSSSVSRDGGLPSFICGDEGHLWVSPELKRLHGVLMRNLAKRELADPWMFEPTTAFAPGEMSIAEEAHAYAEKVRRGEIDDPTLLYDHLAASFRHDLDTEEGLIAAIREASGLAWDFTNVRAIKSEYEDPRVDIVDFRRYWLNQIVKAVRAWISPEEWSACERPAKSVEHGSQITLGFDGSLFDDATALVGCRLDDGHLFPLAVWEKPEGAAGQGWEVPKGEVDAAVAEAMRDYRVVRFYADPPYWQTEVDAWRKEWGSVVVEWWTHRETPMAFALERFRTDTRSEALSHDGNPVLSRHIANARTRKTRAGYIIEKPVRQGAQKIDCAMAAILAYEARCDAVKAGGKKRSKVPVSH